MKLYHSPTSPYARKARVLILELGLQDRIELIAVNPLSDDAAENLPNPLIRVPALERDDGDVLFDSPVICAYLEDIAGHPMGSGEARWTKMKAEALADGVMDAAFSLVMERRRPAPQQSPEWVQRWTRSILNGVADMARNLPRDTGSGLELDAIAYACALDYLDFRLPDLAWREAHSSLAAWLDTLLDRPSMKATDPR